MNKTGQEYRKKYPIIRPTIVKELAHGIAVSNLARRVGERMGMSREDCYELALAGLLHDIGKLELAKYVYGKENETLIIEEMRYVRRHSRLGADILEKRGYSRKIVDMVRFHHENCDGSGYPMNLSRDEIPLGARILRVCDVFAALTADRPYRKAFDVDTALELMIEEAKYYDVGVFLAFMNLLHEESLEGILDTDELEHSLSELVRKGQITIAEFLAEREAEQAEAEQAGKEDTKAKRTEEGCTEAKQEKAERTEKEDTKAKRTEKGRTEAKQEKAEQTEKEHTKAKRTKREQAEIKQTQTEQESEELL